MPSFSQKYFSGAFAIALLALVCSLTHAQQTKTSATVSGHVEDSTGALIKGASILMRNVDTGHEQTAVSDGEGFFRFPYLSVGTYEISVETVGFSRLVRRLTLTVGQTLDLPLRLAVKGIAENVDITSDLPVIESVRTQLTETLLPREIDALPLNGRNYLDLAA